MCAASSTSSVADAKRKGADDISAGGRAVTETGLSGTGPTFLGMPAAALPRRDRITTEDVAARARRFPLVGEILGERLAAHGEHRGVAVDKAPRLLSLLAQNGAGSAALLAGIEAAVRQFDALKVPGWGGVRRRLGAERRQQFMPVLSEIVAARWALSAGLTVEQFEPASAEGRRADLVMGVHGQPLTVEVATPTAANDDWTERANPRLRAGLERVQSGLVIEVEGYDALRFEPGGPWGLPHDAIGDGQVDAVVLEFARAASRLGHAAVPAEVVTPRSGQPVRITVVAREEAIDGTAVEISWSRSGLVPPVQRLCAIVEHERKQLPPRVPCAVLVDLSCWSDFRGEDFYLNAAADELGTRTSRALVCTYDWRAPDLLPTDRKILADGDFASTELGRAVSGAWLAVQRPR